MFDKYFQRFEELISPRNFSIQSLGKSKSTGKLGNEAIKFDRNVNKYENENIFEQGAYLINELNSVSNERNNLENENTNEEDYRNEISSGGIMASQEKERHERNESLNSYSRKYHSNTTKHKDEVQSHFSKQKGKNANQMANNHSRTPSHKNTNNRSSADTRYINKINKTPTSSVMNQRISEKATINLQDFGSAGILNHNQDQKYYQMHEHENDYIEAQIKDYEREFSDGAHQYRAPHSSNNSTILKKESNVDIDFLKNKIHKLNKLNMNLRFEVAKLTEKLETCESKLVEQDKVVKSLEKQRESDTEYLLKLENLIQLDKMSISKHNKSSYNSNNVSTNSIYLNQSGTGMNKSLAGKTINKSQNPNKSPKFNKTTKMDEPRYITLDNNFIIDLNDKTELNNLLQMIYQENQKLKNFQNSVIQLSKTYDEINENMVSWMKDVNILIETLPNNYEEVNFQTIISNFNNIIENIEQTLKTKKSEYNYFLNIKEDEIKVLTNEIFHLRERNEQIKKDWLKDQKLLAELEKEKFMFNLRYQESPKAMEKSVYFTKPKEANKINKTIEPVRQEVSKIIKNIETGLDLKDEGNQRFMERISMLK